MEDFLEKLTEGIKGEYTLIGGGSSCLPWISGPRDIDYIFFFREVNDVLTANANYRKYRKDKGDKTCVIIHIDAINTPRYPWWAYQLLFAETLRGNKETLYQYRDMKEFLENPTEEIKRHIARDIHDSFFKVWCYTKHFDENPKILYHVYIWKCLLEKGNLNLTEEEGRMVNDLHDRKFSKEELDRMKEGFEGFFRQYL